jgi:hypothetical protein
MWTRALSSAFVLLAVMGCWSCNGCPRGPSSQTLAFNASKPALNAVNLASGITAGTIALTDANVASALQPTQCVFYADLVAAPANLQANGNPGDPNFNLAIAVFNMRKSGAACASSSSSPTEILIAPSRGLFVGQTTTTGDAQFVVNGKRFSTSRGYFEFTLTSFDRGGTGNPPSAPVPATGTFQAIALNDSDPNDTVGLVITGGSFSMPIH